MRLTRGDVLQLQGLGFAVLFVILEEGVKVVVKPRWFRVLRCLTGV
jgi:hypothetical protein